MKEKNINNNIGNQIKRVSSIDSLRAIVLLGIFIVHAHGGFGFNIVDSFSVNIWDGILEEIIRNLLSHKCAVVFNVLFGVSFYFILKRPLYPSKKFIWRCVLLFVIGLFNKLFYTYDALCWYAIWGIVLVAFRNFSNRNLLYMILILKFISIFMPLLHLEAYFPKSDYNRYAYTNSFEDLIFYPYALFDYLRIVLRGSVVGCLSNFLIGYYIGRRGWIEELHKYVNTKLLSIAFIIYLPQLVLSIVYHYNTVILGLSGGFFYSSCVIYAHYNIKTFKGVLHYLESYGKLGLTNYSTQSIFGVFYVYWGGQLTLKYGFGALLCIVIFFYILQALFSHCWLLNYKYGPMEYLWRSLTDLKFNGNKK